MGNFIKINNEEIAKITKYPAVVSLAGNPNFIQFESTKESKDTALAYIIKLNDVMLASTQIVFNRGDKGDPITINGVSGTKEIGRNTFNINMDIGITAENLMKCLMKEPFLKTNFKFSLEFDKRSDGNIQPAHSIYLYPMKTTGSNDITINGIDDNFALIIKESVNANPDATDTIRKANSNCEIELSIHRNNELFPGQNDELKLGSDSISISKTYVDQPIWFDLNALFSNQQRYSNKFLNADSWCNTGTMTDLRFVARRYDGIDYEAFYISDPLFTVTGYRRNLEENSLAPYVFNLVQQNSFKPLTNMPTLTHVKGQTQYFNFILADPARKIRKEAKTELGILYRLYTQSGKYIGEVEDNKQLAADFDPINTIRLHLDEMLDAHPQKEKIGRITAQLICDKKVMSEPMTFHILPEFLYKVNDFAFLNALGGWSSFNFGGTMHNEFKAKANTIYKTQTPNHSISSEIEAIYNKESDEQFVVETTPLTAQVAEWLKELSASIAVYELSSKRYVIVDDLSIKHNTKDDLFVLQMKYHYSDSYN